MKIYFDLFKYSVNYSMYVFIWINFFITFGDKYAEKYLAARKAASLTKSSRCHVVETSRSPSRTGKATPSRHRWCENDVARDDGSYVQYNLYGPLSILKIRSSRCHRSRKRRQREKERRRQIFIHSTFFPCST